MASVIPVFCMHFSLIFENSGDVLPFTSVNTDVLVYYVESINRLGINKFSISTSVSNSVDQNITALDSVIKKFNNLPITHILDTEIAERRGLEYLDQHYLNQLHADWVRFQKCKYHIQLQRNKYNSSPITEQIHDCYSDDISVVRVGDVLDKLKLKEEFDDINFYIHRLESCFSYVKAAADTPEWIEIPNPFDKNLLSNDIANLTIDFNHLGRTLYNKFQMFDHKFECDDENSYNELLKDVAIKIKPPETIPLSQQYIDACHAAGRTPRGNFLNIGNLINLNERLTEYRKIVYNNTQARNKFSFELHKE